MREAAENQRTEEYYTAGKRSARAYMRTVILMLLKAVEEVAGPGCRVNVGFKFGGNYYLTMPGRVPDQAFTEAVKKRMRQIADADLPVRQIPLSVEDAMAAAAAGNDRRQERILHYMAVPQTFYYEIDGFARFFCDTLLDRTGRAVLFDLIPFRGGILLQLPKTDDPGVLSDICVPEKQFLVQQRGEWDGYNAGLYTLSDLNNAIASEKIGELVLQEESRFDQKICEAAAAIKASGCSFVMVAGPSSSGKTTTTHRLAIQLKTYGLNPQVISADNYYKSGDCLPILPDGTTDTESVDALDTDLFSRDMQRLLSGEEVELPTFNFAKRAREYRGNTVRLGENRILVVEGVHCLNPQLTGKLPEKSRFGLYLSALSSLNIDDYTPVSMSDCRLLRRIVRDNRTRGTGASETLSMWPAVRLGEEKYIFPHQETADLMINTTLDYELSVLKLYAAPLLFGIGRDDPQYGEARRLLRFLEYVLPMPPELIPGTSILREFIGGSLIDIS